MKYIRINGPRIRPNTPNRNRPPIIPIRTITEDTSVFFATIYGRNILSIPETIIALYKIKLSANNRFPLNKRQIDIGIQTNPGPTTGIIEKNTARTDRTRACGIENIKKPIPAVIP